MNAQAVAINNLTKMYNSHTALKGINLSIDAGDFFGLLGPNGAGKTTLIGILATLVNKTSGQVKIFDTDLERNPEKAKSYMGLVPQEQNFNVFENVKQTLVNQAGFYGIPRRKAKQQAEEKLQQLGLTHKKNNRILELSGGMKRRLMIARALVHNPDILILDEPTAGVDLEIRHSLWQLMQQINSQGVTIILTTHYLEEVEYLCRRIAIIDRGEIIENTSTETLLNKQQRECYIITLEKPQEDLNLAQFRHWKIDNYNFEVEINGDQTMSELFQELQTQQISVKRVGRRKTRLEELFLQLTGA